MIVINMFSTYWSGWSNWNEMSLLLRSGYVILPIVASFILFYFVKGVIRLTSHILWKMNAYAYDVFLFILFVLGLVFSYFATYNLLPEFIRFANKPSIPSGSIPFFVGMAMLLFGILYMNVCARQGKKSGT